MYPKINKKKEEEGEGERDKRREETTKGFAVASTVACPFCFVVRRLKVSTHTHIHTRYQKKKITSVLHKHETAYLGAWYLTYYKTVRNVILG